MLSLLTTSSFRAKFSGNRSICVKFRTDEKQYFFSEKVLIDNFTYFESALRRGQSNEGVFIEGCTDTVHLEEISTRAFARLFRFVQAEPYVYTDCADLDHLLQAVIAADYLGLKNFSHHEKHICERLRLLLLEDRRKLTAAHLELVPTHDAFKHTRVWEVFAKAAAKPFLMESMLDYEYKPDWLVGCNKQEFKRTGRYLGRGPYGSCMFPETWESELRHCRDLRRNNKDYNLEVVDWVSWTLTKGRGYCQECDHQLCMVTEGGPEHMPAITYKEPLAYDYLTPYKPESNDWCKRCTGEFIL